MSRVHRADSFFKSYLLVARLKSPVRPFRILITGILPEYNTGLTIRQLQKVFLTES